MHHFKKSIDWHCAPHDDEQSSVQTFRQDGQLGATIGLSDVSAQIAAHEN